MYLTQLTLNPRNRRVHKQIAEPYEMHRSIMRAFPEHLDRAQERVLFRLDAPRGGGPPVLLVQSLAQPDWSCVGNEGFTRYLVATNQPNPWVKQVEIQLKSGQVLAFRLRANPTIKRRGKRLGLYRDEEQMGWLARKAEQGGFRILSAHSCNEKIVGGIVRRESRKDHLRLLSVQFDGLLQVVDAERVRRTVEGGIGSGKAFGLGLLSLARPI